MTISNAYVRARIDEGIKARATDALEAMGLSVSDAIRLLMVRVADERCLPFEVKAPNRATITAIKELESGKAKKANSIDDLMAELNAND